MEQVRGLVQRPTACILRDCRHWHTCDMQIRASTQVDVKPPARTCSSAPRRSGRSS